MYKLVVTELAHQDLDTIVSYVAIQLANPAAASDFLDKADKSYGYLRKNSLMYSKCYNSKLERGGYRKAVIKNYILVYKVDENAKTVSIVRFFYGARDYTKFI